MRLQAQIIPYNNCEHSWDLVAGHPSFEWTTILLSRSTSDLICAHWEISINFQVKDWAIKQVWRVSKSSTPEQYSGTRQNDPTTSYNEVYAQAWIPFSCEGLSAPCNGSCSEAAAIAFFLPSSLGIRLIDSLCWRIYNTVFIEVRTGIYRENRRIIGRDPNSPSSRSLSPVLIIRLVNALSLLWYRGRVVDWHSGGRTETQRLNGSCT